LWHLDFGGFKAGGGLKVEMDTRYNSASAELEEIKRMLKRGDFDAARRLAHRAGEGFGKNGNQLGQIWVRLYHADISFGLGAFQLALEESFTCLELFSSLGSREGMGWASRNLQRSFCMLGQMSRSIDHGRQALEIFDTLKDPKGASVAMRWMGVAHLNMGELQTARAETISAMRQFYYVGDAPRMLECVHDLGFLAEKEGRPAEALRLHHYVLRHTQSPRWAVIHVMSSIGRLEAQRARLPLYDAQLDVLIPALLSGKDLNLEPHSSTVT
jgi:tetratricopeptide (TPR) repeat protein